jgi:hypothetical protein
MWIVAKEGILLKTKKSIQRGQSSDPTDPSQISGYQWLLKNGADLSR